MAQNKSNISPDNMAEWAASTGFIFPRTIKELMRFEKLYGDIKFNLEGCQIDPEKILGRKGGADVVQMPQKKEEEKAHFKMAARKGDSNIPQHILDKIKKNQDQRKNDDDGAKEKKT